MALPDARLRDKLELLLAESPRIAHETGALRGQDHTVQSEAFTFPADAKLLHADISGLNFLP